jgi:hypothetical protein
LRVVITAGVDVDREKQISVLAIGNCGSLLERDIDVGASREDDIETVVPQQLFEAQCHIQREIGFIQSFRLRAGIVAAVTGIDDDPSDTEAKLAGQGKPACRVGAGGGRGGLSLSRRCRRCRWCRKCRGCECRKCRKW